MPVDPVSIARGLGIKVFLGDLPEGVSGMLVKQPRFDPEIYINGSDSPTRQRFTCAHELGHYVKRASSDDDFFEYVDTRGPSASRGTRADEIYANGFAAALLMPREAVERLARHGETAGEMAYRFGVSLEALRNRLANLGVHAV